MDGELHSEFYYRKRSHQATFQEGERSPSAAMMTSQMTTHCKSEIKLNRCTGTKTIMFSQPFNTVIRTIGMAALAELVFHVTLPYPSSLMSLLSRTLT